MPLPDPIPTWLRQDLIALSALEPLLFPDYVDDRKLAYFETKTSNATSVFFDLKAQMDAARPRILFLVSSDPSEEHDSVLIPHLQAMAELGIPSAILTTSEGELSWSEKIPSSVAVIELGNPTRHLIKEEQQLILTELILSSSLDAIHVIDSHEAWEMIFSYGKTFKQVGINVFTSLSGHEVNATGAAEGYAANHLPDCFEWITAILTHNKHFALSLQYRDGYPANRIFTLYSPATSGVAGNENGPRSAANTNVLSASRIVRQTDLSIFLEIAEASPELTFHLFGEVEQTTDPELLEKLASTKNCVHHGAYHGFSHIPNVPQYGAFLYLSIQDGIAPVLMEAIQSVLPVVASNAGGIAELIHEETGYPVSDFQNVMEYRENLLAALSVNESSNVKVKNALHLVQTRHSMAEFTRALKQIPGYPTSPPHPSL